MDKEGGGYYFFLEKYDNHIFKIQMNISQLAPTKLLQYIGLRTVCRQFANEVWNMFEVWKFGNPQGRPILN